MVRLASPEPGTIHLAANFGIERLVRKRYSAKGLVLRLGNFLFGDKILPGDKLPFKTFFTLSVLSTSQPSRVLQKLLVTG